jgi:hypothetical protein
VTWAVEELGAAHDLHPGWCRLRHDPTSPHRSVTFTVAGRRVWATADAGWQVTVHRAGTGSLSDCDAALLSAVVEYLSVPA